MIRADGIVGASYAGDPRSNTVMFVAKKVERLLENLGNVSDCLVFVDADCVVPEIVRQRNSVVETANPQLDYARFLQHFIEREQEEDAHYPPALTEGGYYLSPKAAIGDGVRIEPGAVIYAGVSIGDGCDIHSGAVIRHASIGAESTIKSNACIGDQSFNFARDERGNLVRIPSVGGVRIGEGAEIGCLSTVCRGMAGDTVIADHVKIDDHVHIAHDVRVGGSSELAAGVVVGGYCAIGRGCFIGVNASLKNRIGVGNHCFVGMGSAVARNVPDGTRVFGNPARKLDL